MAQFWTLLTIILLCHGLSSAGRLVRQVDEDEVNERYGDDQGRRTEFGNNRRPPQFSSNDGRQFGNGGFGQNGGFVQNGGFNQNERFPNGQNGFSGQNGGIDQSVLDDVFGQSGQNNRFPQAGQNIGQNQQQQQQNTAQQNAFTACARSCLSTTEYNPVCGSNGITYANNGRYECANRCSGGLLTIVRQGPCIVTDTSITPPPSR